MVIELETPDCLIYMTYPVNINEFIFKVKAPNNAHIGFASDRTFTKRKKELIIGGWRNKKSALTLSGNAQNLVEIDTPGILHPEEYRGFWIRWQNQVLSIGREGENAPFISYEMRSRIVIKSVGVCTGWGASGSWIIETPPSAEFPQEQMYPSPPCNGPGRWIQVTNGRKPADATPCSEDSEPLYIGRGIHQRALTPGKVVPSEGVLCIAWGGSEHTLRVYEVLCGTGYQWMSASGGSIPPQAIIAGQSESGESLFVGRVIHNGKTIPGKVHPSHGSCYIAYEGREIGYDDYEILVSN